MQNKKLGYIDGLRGIGATMVYFCHFIFTFYFAAYSLDSSQAHTVNAIEAALGKTPVNLLYNGNFAVRLFFVISGYVLCIGYFKTKDRKRLKDGAAKRYFRLFVPIAFTNILIYLLMKAGAYHNVEASILTKSTWVDKFNAAQPNIFDVIKETFFNAYFIFGNKTYNAVLWTIPYLFLISIMIYAVAALVGSWKYRYIIYGAITIVLLLGDLTLTIDMIAIFSGYVLCDVMYTQRWLETIRKRRVFQALVFLVFLFGLYLASYPSAFSNDLLPTGTIYGILGTPMVVPFHLVGAFFIVAAVVNNERLQSFFGARIFVVLGKRSYSLFLVHFPIISTFSCWFFLLLYGKLQYGWLILLDFILTSILIGLVSEFMYRYIEPLGKKLEMLFLSRFLYKENDNDK